MAEYKVLDKYRMIYSICNAVGTAFWKRNIGDYDVKISFGIFCAFTVINWL